MSRDVDQELQAYYNQSDAYLERMSNHDEEFFEPYVTFLADNLAGHERRILDIGCGPGLSSWLIAQRFPELQVLGVDLSEKFIDYAKHNHQRPNLTFQVMNATKLDLADASFDVIASNDVIEHIPDVESHLSQCDRVLAQNGLVLIMSPNILNPVMPLYFAMTGQRCRGRKLSTLSAVSEFIRLLVLFARKRMQKRAFFTYIDPLLDDSVQTGADADAVFLCNPVDLELYFRAKEYTITNLTMARTSRMRAIRALSKYWAPVAIAARKKGQ